MTGISTKKDIEYIKAVFNDLSEALTQMAYGQVVLPVDIKGLLSDIQASLIKGRLPCALEVDCFEESLLLFLRSVRQQRQSIVCTTEVDRQMARLRDVRYFLVVLTGYPERVQEPPRLLWRWRDIKTLSVLFLSVVLSFCSVLYLASGNNGAVHGVYCIAIILFSISIYALEESGVGGVVFSLSGVTIFTVAALCEYLPPQ